MAQHRQGDQLMKALLVLNHRLGHCERTNAERTAAFPISPFMTNGGSRFPPPSVKGTEYAVTTDRFQEAKFNWPLLGNESWKATVASVPIPV